MGKIRQIIRRTIYSSDLLFKLYYRHFYKPQEGSLSFFLDNFSREHSDAHFLQIGGNDGIINDPFYKFIRRDNWKGLVLEPQKEIFSRLLRTYSSNKKVTPVNCAIFNTSGKKQLFKIAFSNSRRLAGLSSFFHESIQKMIDVGYVDQIAIEENIKTPEKQSDYITTEEVECLTFQDLINKNNIQKLDALLIDTEGYDFEIIKQFDFSLMKPEIIVYEHAGLDRAEKESCEKYLKNLGYNIFKDEADVFASLNVR